MKEYSPTIGLEIHAELKTKTKMFCNSKNDPNEKRPNVNVCPICMAHPGTLPVINKEAVKHVLRIGGALNGTIANFTEFDRKNYFYPDIPKGYQISQYKFPLVSGGSLNNVQLTRVHLEEDTARSMHDQDDKESLIDFNRAGIPLMELVTEPVLHSSKDAGNFARELQLLLRYLDAGEANMEKGEMRVEANVSVSKGKEMGTKVELKNLNSFRNVEKAIEYEIARQVEVSEGGGKIVQETRGWDDKKEITFSQRKKESSHDYRYFPDPDLPKLYLNEIEEFKNLELPELPWKKRERYKKEFGIKDEDIEMYVNDTKLAEQFETQARILKTEKQITLLSNLFTSNITGLLKTTPELKFPKAGYLAEVVIMQEEGRISSTGVRGILEDLFISNDSPEQIAIKKGLLQKSDEGELKKIVEKIIHENQKPVEEFKNGKESSLKFLIGQGMKESKGSANPQILDKLFRESLKN